MKYAALQAAKLLLLAVLAVLLWGTLHADPQQADFSVLREQAEQAMDTTGMRQADAQLLRRLYGLNGGELADWALWTSEDNMAVEELLLAECVSEAQAEQVFKNIKAVLAEAGTDETKVVKATVFLKSMDDFAAVNEVYASFFSSSSVLPARSAVAVQKLPKDVMVEVEVIAVL